jgi:hypothetical protein
VPLSDREQKILEEIERNLYREDPAFAQGVRRRGPRMDEMRRAKLGALLFVCGFGLLIGFFVSSAVLIGVVAFAAMVGGIVLVAGSIRAMGPWRRAGTDAPRDRWGRALRDLEQRIRRRYKRR